MATPNIDRVRGGFTTVSWRKIVATSVGRFCEGFDTLATPFAQTIAKSRRPRRLCTAAF
jgi:hypothetical protein